MKMKRFLSILLAFLLSLSILSGCAKQETPTAGGEEQAPKVETQAPETTETPLDPQAVILEHATAYLNSIPENSNMIAAKDAMPLIDENPDALFIVDMRSKEDYDKGHLPGAVNIPFDQIGKNLDRLPTNKQIVMYCYSGQTSGLGVSAVKLLGFNVISYQGGMNFGWSPLELAEDTLETTENPLPDAKTSNLTEEEQILWDAVDKFFSEGKTYMEKADDVFALVEDNPDAIFIVDLRSGEDFEKGHIEGATNIAFKEVGKNLDKLPKNRPIYLACYSGQTAAQVMTMLRLSGYNASIVTRGMAGWSGAELPVVTE
ncbi:MAG: rhodanese-like domain-containing protein [Tissierellaceae bacterium]